LGRFSGTVVAITHDRYFLDKVAEWILDMERGNTYIYEGNYNFWLENKLKRQAQEQKVGLPQ
jgi:energy-dependent translational throttle protein EttA